MRHAFNLFLKGLQFLTACSASTPKVKRPSVERCRLLLGSSALGSVAAQLPLRLGLDGALRPLDGRGTGDGSGTEVGAVARLGNEVGNVLVGPIWRRARLQWSAMYTRRPQKEKERKKVVQMHEFSYWERGSVITYLRLWPEKLVW